MKIEGQLFIDEILPALHAAGIHAIPIHDGMMVPKPLAEEAQRIAEQRALDLAGLEMRIGV